MIYESRSILLKDGTAAILRSPTAQDAAAMVEFLKATASETEFVLRYPEECVITTQQEASFLQGILDSPNELMLLCESDGQIVGNCHISFNSFIKTRHRATIGIAILRSHWNLGLGTLLLRELINAAAARQVCQLELDVIEGNRRATALYEKLGFCVVAEFPDAIRTKNGSILKEYRMVKKL